MVDGPTAGAARTPDLGVLLVHGIGNHKQGETLNEFAAPIVKWIDRWLVPDERVELVAGAAPRRVSTKDVVGAAVFVRGTLRPPDLPLDTPAHASATITTSRGAAPPTEQSWLFAESWWSPQTLSRRAATTGPGGSGAGSSRRGWPRWPRCRRPWPSPGRSTRRPCPGRPCCGSSACSPRSPAWSAMSCFSRDWSS